MRFFWRIAAGLLAAVFLLASVAGAAELSYSGVPGKFKRGSKEAKEPKEKAAEAADKTQEAPKEKGKRTLVLPRSGDTTAPVPAAGSSKK